MNIFLTGATGYIGGSVAERLVKAGHKVVGLVRTEEKAVQLRERGIEPLLGTLEDSAIVAEATRNADAVINAADSDHEGVIAAILSALEGTGKTFIHTSGSSIVSDLVAGEDSGPVYDESNRPEPVPDKVARVAIDRTVEAAAQKGIRSIVICPTMIYGRGSGISKESHQIPMLVRQTRKSGVARYIGKGANIWSNVHIDDLVELYILALEKAPAGTFYFAENGEEQLKSVVESVSKALGLGGRTESWPIESAIQEWGHGAALYGLASNSRVRAKNAREILGWQPQYNTIHEYIATEYGV